MNLEYDGTGADAKAVREWSRRRQLCAHAGVGQEHSPDLRDRCAWAARPGTTTTSLGYTYRDHPPGQARGVVLSRRREEHHAPCPYRRQHRRLHLRRRRQPADPHPRRRQPRALRIRQPAPADGHSRCRGRRLEARATTQGPPDRRNRSARPQDRIRLRQGRPAGAHHRCQRRREVPELHARRPAGELHRLLGQDVSVGSTTAAGGSSRPSMRRASPPATATARRARLSRRRAAQRQPPGSARGNRARPTARANTSCTTPKAACSHTPTRSGRTHPLQLHPRGPGRRPHRRGRPHRCSYQWDLLGRLTELQNENGSRYDFSYDPVGRLLEETGFDRKATRYRYEEATGVLAEVVDAGAQSPRSPSIATGPPCRTPAPRSRPSASPTTATGG